MMTTEPHSLEEYANSLHVFLRDYSAHENACVSSSYAADRLGVSRHMVKRFVANGALLVNPTVGKNCKRILLHSVDRLRESRGACGKVVWPNPVKRRGMDSHGFVDEG